MWQCAPDSKSEHVWRQSQPTDVIFTQSGRCRPLWLFKRIHVAAQPMWGLPPHAMSLRPRVGVSQWKAARFLQWEKLRSEPAAEWLREREGWAVSSISQHKMMNTGISNAWLKCLSFSKKNPKRSRRRRSSYRVSKISNLSNSFQTTNSLWCRDLGFHWYSMSSVLALR